MPAHKGIKLHIISQWELKMHPEFPHPESTQFTFRSPKLDKEAFEGHGHSPATKSNDSKADRLLGRQSSIISVYIPSASGSRFFIRYNVGGAADQGPWFYFKLYMNGRHVTSWGTNTKNRPSGQVMRALFEPGVEWDYKEGKTTYKNPGTEYRPFFFSQEDGDCAAADDGGLIEIKVFRAHGRKRRNPQLAQYKDQSKYGVIMPTHGLVEKPQDARYYDWHLKDAKDNPFVTFKFHYRSWDHLEKLHLIPPNHPRILEAQVPAMARHLMASSQIIPQPDQPTESPHTPTKYLGKVYTSDQVHDSLRAAYPPFDLSGSPYDSDERQPWMSRILDTNQLDSLLTVKKDHRDAFIVSSDSTTEPDPFYISSSGEKGIERKIMPISKFSALSIDGAGSASSHEWLVSEYNTRPLPDIPSRTSSAASRASATSRAPSVTPSLLSYIDRDQPSPEPVIGTAIAVSIDSDVSEISIEYKDDSGEDEFDEKYNFEGLSALSPPPSRTDSRIQGIISSSTIKPSFSLPNVTIRKQQHSIDEISPLRIPPRKDSITGKSYVSTASDDNTGTISLAESEWMRRTPSPVKESEWMRRTPSPIKESKWMRRTPSPTKETIIERLWSPTPEKREIWKNRLLSPERMAEMMELSITEDDNDLPQQEQETEDNAWDVDRGLDGGAVELVTLHHQHYLSERSGRENVGVDYDDGNVSGDYEVNAVKMREKNGSGSSPENFENRISMRDGNWI
ncbi:hypothetical protein BPAE_0133g00240 [Botrytis paeoniae]|uniref:DUF7918 domain-containing protein n=1 Tax=Botrytis paeoniae TaxID=278948 RepID=A0A4Z1FG98_9HELO|nr:hypothetical protein BPAE_0133g00240 [Botrytis paeoniae]